MEKHASKPLILCATASDRGLVRQNNEDGVWLCTSFIRDGGTTSLIPPEDIRHGVFLGVADGVGGAAAGEVASEFVLRRIAAELSAVTQADDASLDSATVVNAGTRVNQELLEEAKRERRLSGMATTLTGVLVREAAAWWFNAGDSRLYETREESLVQVTRDHTLREMTGDPRIPGNIITNCFGGQNEFFLDVGILELADGQVYLLCTDGLSDYAPHSTMQSEMLDLRARLVHGSEPDAETPELNTMMGTAEALVSAAKSGGGADNISCLLFTVRYP